MTTANVPNGRLRLCWFLGVPLACALGIGLWRYQTHETEKSPHTTTNSAAEHGHEIPNPTPATDAHRNAGVAADAPTAPEPTKDDQPGAPVIESPEVIASMDIEFVADEVKRIDKELHDRNAIERLNSGDVSDAERLEFGAMMHRAALFRHRLLEHSVESLQNDVEEYSKGHAERVAKYSKQVARR
ncbi:MAG: hypothetical protein QM784_10230 [Polyangiaceae bacterium]